MSVVSRLAPSPTGAQHFGNARTYLLAWLSARSQGGRVLLRIENIDSPRVKPWAQQQVLDDLLWLGLDWDGDPVIQTERIPLYAQSLQVLQQAEFIYPCTCSRSDIEAAASAPHRGQEPPVYPGFCAGRSAHDPVVQIPGPIAWRFRVSAHGDFPGSQLVSRSQFQDLVAGVQTCDVATELGDFVVARQNLGTMPPLMPAYQLAVVIDDHAMGVTEVVRGDDLIASTHRQRQLLTAFGWTPPTYAHVPLVIGPDGRRLAKRHGDTRISQLREQGVAAEKLVGLLAWSAGLTESPQPVSPRELLPRFEWSQLHREPFCLTPELWNSLLFRPT